MVVTAKPVNPGQSGVRGYFFATITTIKNSQWRARLTETNAMSEMQANDYVAHPLVDGMRRAGAIAPYFDLPIRDPQQDGWISGEELFLGNDQRLRDLVGVATDG